MKLRFWLARITVQATAPLAIGTGRGDDLRDALFAVGGGGLPYLPGTSLAGVLKTRCDDRPGVDVDRLFGNIPKETRAATTGSPQRAQASRLHVSCGHVHDSADRPVLLDARPGEDDVLRACEAGVTRDHVRLDGAGVADGRGKFDDSAAPVGARFTFELRLDQPRDGEVDALLAALVDLRLGGKTRRGFGSLRVVRCLARDFSLTVDADRTAWRALGVDLSAAVDLACLGFCPAALPDRPARGVPLHLTLRAQDYWLVGGGQALDGVTEHWADDKPRNKLPWSERAISWHDGRGTVTDRPVPVVPGSGVKGALRHRTAFHLRRLAAAAGVETQATEDGLASLFGEVKGNDADDASTGGRPGLVSVTDAVLDADAWRTSGALSHVSLDRFTGGPMPGLLFSEAPLYGGSVPLRLHIDPAPNGRSVDLHVRQAFAWALRDLVEGRLALGTGRNAGHGYFRGQLDDLAPLRAWLQEAA